MKRFLKLCLLGVAVLLGALLGCEVRFNPAFLPDPGQPVTIGDTNYVEILPPWGGFGNPRAIMVGNDQLIYVADYDRNEIVMMDAGGSVLRRRGIPHPISIAQNSKLDLYVGGETIAPNGVDTIGAIYRIFLVRLDTTYVARIDTVINPISGDTSFIPVEGDTSFYYDHQLDKAPMHTVWQEPGRTRRRYSGIGILPDNEYLVARVGSDNSSFVDPDTRVLHFGKKDELITSLGDLITRPSGGTAITDINKLTNLAVYPASSDFIVTQLTEGVAFGAIWMVYQSTADFEGWLPKYDPTKPDQRGVDFIRPYRFKSATGVAIDRRRREVFVVDAVLDSIVKFDRNGRFKPESFGNFKTTSRQFPGIHKPSGAAFSNDCTLYIADAGNQVIRRFKLSTQAQCN